MSASPQTTTKPGVVYSRSPTAEELAQPDPSANEAWFIEAFAGVESKTPESEAIAEVTPEEIERIFKRWSEEATQ